MKRLAFIVPLVLCLSKGAHAGPDYAPGSTEWNGLSRLFDVAREAGCEIVAPDSLDWSELGAGDVLWFVYPRAAVEPRKLSRFLAAGGRAVVADDFGAGAQTLESLGIRRGKPALSALERYNRNLNLPVAHGRLHTELGRATDALVANHPASFESAMPPTYEFAPGAALVVEGRVGKGYFVAIADPSVFINNMLELDGNLAFARALVQRTCRPGERIRLFTQTFTASGEPPANLSAPPEPGSKFAQFNAMLTGFNAAAKRATTEGHGMYALVAFGVVIALVMFGGAFPTRGEIRDRWTRIGRLAAPDGLHPEERNPFDFGQPAAILRDEVLARLALALGEPIDFDWTGPQALAKKVEAELGPTAALRAAELWRLLHRVRWRTVDGEIVADERVTRRTLLRLHQLATALFDTLELDGRKAAA